MIITGDKVMPVAGPQPRPVLEIIAVAPLSGRAARRWGQVMYLADDGTDTAQQMYLLGPADVMQAGR